jgi:Ser/Thr protein kinase RdoA (MazF antagonist)
VRRKVPGYCDPWKLFHRCQADSGLAWKIGHSIGAILSEQHVRIAESDVAGWLQQTVPWPEPSEWIRKRLPHVVGDHALLTEIEHVLARYEAVLVEAQDRVLVHGDLGLHNLAFDPCTDMVNGVFDYDSAAWTDRHHDFRYFDL